jgi:hypothetical protein
MEIFIPICLLGGLFVCVAAPIVGYLRAYERGKNLWPRTFVRTYRVGEGAYRSMEVREERSVFVPPANVDVVAATGAFLGMMWLPSAPFVLVGLLCEADHKGPGPALIFGLSGMALSFAIMCTGPGLLERKTPRGARAVASWSLVHNAIVLATVAYATATFALGTSDPIGLKSYDVWRMYALDNVVGLIALVYASASIVHAIYMRRAANALLREGEGFTESPPPEQGRACSSPSFQSSFAPPS